FYLSGEPRWWTPAPGVTWTKPPFPPIGPDVLGGNITSSPTGGHANKIPARLCFEKTLTPDTDYGVTPAVMNFNRARCYTDDAGGGTQAAPTISAQPPQTQTVSEGSNVSISLTATGNPFPAYQWKKGTANVVNGGRISGANTNTL